ncbi:hypothetical protein ACEZCY_05910 [Streptacidiphilus sp. N1-12]|uniref:PadR family transcriptional regulator n=2 Tax=Streptacidiphilus alkalitolerans TaxID=3342712 RepID=A0ABV6V5B7_9ACTN
MNSTRARTEFHRTGHERPEWRSRRTRPTGEEQERRGPRGGRHGFAEWPGDGATGRRARGRIRPEGPQGGRGAGPGHGHRLLTDGVDQLATAVGQITRTGTAEDKSAAADVLADARRALYRLLADSE